MDVAKVDPDDTELFDAWFDAYGAGVEAGRTDPPVALRDEVRAHFRVQEASYVHEAWAVTDGDTVVGGGWIAAPTADNLTFGALDLAVAPEHRGRGAGRAGYDRLAARLAELGRSTFGAEIFQPFGASPVPGAAFATARGFSRRNVESRRVLDLAATSERWPALADHAAERAAGYRLVGWHGRCPDAYAEQVAQLQPLVETDSPTGDLELEPERWDVARLRAQEGATAAQGRSRFTTIALAPDGVAVGLTHLAVPDASPEMVFQSGTIVRREHRGRRLALAMKVANLREVTAAVPQARTVNSYNADSNAPMVAVNDALGFRAVEHLESWQRSPAGGPDAG